MKNLANALIIESAVAGAMLAAQGLTAPREILDHKGGLAQVFDRKLDFSRIWSPATSSPKILLANVKTFPCIGTAQTAVAAAIEMHRLLKGKLGLIEHIIVTMADVPMVRDQQAEEARRIPTTREEADHSFTFLPAVALTDGELSERQFTEKRWSQPAMRELARKVELELSADLARRAPGSMPCRLRVIFSDGDEIVTECLYSPGHSFPERGLNRLVVESKFRASVEGALAPDAANRIVFAINEAERNSRLTEIVSHI